MGERKDLIKSLTIMILAIIITLVIANFSSISPPGYILEKYEAHLTENGILYENYTYIIYEGGLYHMLYRKWETPLYYGTLKDEGIYLINVSFSGKTLHFIPYVKTHYNGIYILGNATYSQNDISYISKRANSSEAGIYIPSGIPAGKYTVRYVFLLYPVIEKGKRFYHLSLNLGSVHPKYENTVIEIPNKFNPVGPPYLQEKENGSSVIFKGKTMENYPMLVDLLFNNITGFPHISIKIVNEDLENKVKNDHFVDGLRYWTAYYFFTVIYYIVLFFPLAYLLAYLLVGRDTARPVEDEVLTPPAKREPWVVNYIFKNEGIKVDYKDVIISSILNLHRHGILEISNDGKKINILREPSPQELNDYEANLFTYIKENSEDGTLYLDKSTKRMKNNKENLGFGCTDMLLIDSETRNKIFEKFIFLPDKIIGYTFILGLGILFGSIVALIFANSYGSYLIWAMLLSIPYFIHIFAMWHYPGVLGRWKEDYYTEKLRWDKFAKFLKDEEKVREKYMEFRSYWDDWLIYGYALGVGNHVRKALSAPDIKYSLAERIGKVEGILYMAFPVPLKSGAGGGVGVGFGGGGAGAR